MPAGRQSRGRAGRAGQGRAGQTPGGEKTPEDDGKSTVGLVESDRRTCAAAAGTRAPTVWGEGLGGGEKGRRKGEAKTGGEIKGEAKFQGRRKGEAKQNRFCLEGNQGKESPTLFKGEKGKREKHTVSTTGKGYDRGLG